jgi:hypothetical protein
VNACRFTPDGKAVTVRTDNGLMLEDTTSGQELITIPGNLGRPLAIAPDVWVGVLPRLTVGRSQCSHLIAGPR